MALAAGARIVIGAVLKPAAEAIAQRIWQRGLASSPEKAIAAGEAAAEAVHQDPTRAIVTVKSSWWNVDNLTRVMTFIAALLALIFGREVFTPQLQLAVVGVLVGFQPLYELWRSRRRTSITKAASVNVLEKPAGK